MASGYITEYHPQGGQWWLEDFLEVANGNAPGGSTGFIHKDTGGDIANFFAARSAGGDCGFNTGFIALDGRDLREWFAAKGSVVTDYARGTMVVGTGGSSQYGYWNGSFGSWSPVSQVSPLNFFYFFPTYNDNTIAFGGALPGDPAQIIATVGGISMYANRLGAGNYATPAAQGDVFNLIGRLGQSLEVVIGPYP